jgi:hypothetical protein
MSTRLETMAYWRGVVLEDPQGGGALVFLFGENQVASSRIAALASFTALLMMSSLGASQAQAQDDKAVIEFYFNAPNLVGVPDPGVQISNATGSALGLNKIVVDGADVGVWQYNKLLQISVPRSSSTLNVRQMKSTALVPAKPFKWADMFEQISLQPSISDGKVVVYCDAGAGLTGACFVADDSCDASRGACAPPRNAKLFRGRFHLPGLL